MRTRAEGCTRSDRRGRDTNNTGLGLCDILPSALCLGAVIALDSARACEPPDDGMQRTVLMMRPAPDRRTRDHRGRTMFHHCSGNKPEARDEDVRTARRHKPRPPMAKTGKAGGSPRPGRSGLQLVHRGLRIARSQECESATWSCDHVGCRTGHRLTS